MKNINIAEIEDCFNRISITNDQSEIIYKEILQFRIIIRKYNIEINTDNLFKEIPENIKNNAIAYALSSFAFDYYHIQRYNLQSESLEEALKCNLIKEDFLKNNSDLAASYIRQGRLEEAENILKSDNVSDNWHEHLNLGTIYFYFKKYDLCSGEYENSLKKSNSLECKIMVNLWKWYLLFETEKYQESIEILNKLDEYQKEYKTQDIDLSVYYAKSYLYINDIEKYIIESKKYGKKDYVTSCAKVVENAEIKDRNTLCDSIISIDKLISSLELKRRDFFKNITTYRKLDDAKKEQKFGMQCLVNVSEFNNKSAREGWIFSKIKGLNRDLINKCPVFIKCYSMESEEIEDMWETFAYCRGIRWSFKLWQLSMESCKADLNNEIMPYANAPIECLYYDEIKKEYYDSSKRDYTKIINSIFDQLEALDLHNNDYSPIYLPLEFLIITSDYNIEKECRFIFYSDTTETKVQIRVYDPYDFIYTNSIVDEIPDMFPNIPYSELLAKKSKLC